MDISSRACAFIRRYLRAFQFSAKPPLSLVHRSIISSQALADSVACFICTSIEFHPYLTFLVRLPTSYRPLSAMPPHFCKYFATRYRRLSLNCRTRRCESAIREFRPIYRVCPRAPSSIRVRMYFSHRPCSATRERYITILQDTFSKYNMYMYVRISARTHSALQIQSLKDKLYLQLQCLFLHGVFFACTFFPCTLASREAPLLKPPRAKLVRRKLHRRPFVCMSKV